MNTLVIITGATASGKSAVALHLAQAHNGVIINADSMQLYADAPILTAQPTPEEQRLVPHALYGIIDAAQGCSVADWLAMSVPVITECWKTNQLPIVTGGTGLYIKALRDGLAALPEIDPHIRAITRSMDAPTLYAALQHEDPAMAVRLRANDTQRLSRALEVIRSTGKSLDWWQQQPVTPPLPDAAILLAVCELPREQLYTRINNRYEKMIEAGGLAEANAVYKRKLSDDLPLLRAVGIKELLDYHKGTLSFEQAIINAKAASRQYAKRQLTWNRKHYVNAFSLNMTDANAAFVMLENLLQ